MRTAERTFSRTAGASAIRIDRPAISLLLGLILILSGCRPDRAGLDGIKTDGLIPVVLQTDWFPQAEHGGFYQALVRGYYIEEGLAVEILPGGPGAMIKHKVSQGMAQFGMNRSDDIIVAVDRGLPLVMAFAVMQRDPQILMMHPGHAAEDFRDLDGRTLVASPGLNWIAFLERRFQIRLNVQPHTYGLTHFLNDPTLIQQGFVTNEPYYLRQHGLDPEILMLADSGFEPYHVIFTNRVFASEHPDTVAAFARASIRGWRDYLEGDPTEAFAMITALNPRMTSDFLSFSRHTLIARHLVTGDSSGEDGIGRLDPARIQREIDQLRELGMVGEGLRIDSVMLTTDPAGLTGSGPDLDHDLDLDR
ncbi:MAG: ABC transporter substrate-binding protein [Opitutaceae bacterium]